MRHRNQKQEIPFESYRKLQEPRPHDERMLRRILYGLSCRNYERCVEVLPQAFGISASTVSRRYIRATIRKLSHLCERRLEPYDFVVLMLDGKTFAQDQMVVALGITLEGKKVILGFVQTATENERAISQFLRELLDRGLSSGPGLLVVMDGSKGIHKAVRQVLGSEVAIQRCQWHKRENVVSYLPKSQQALYRQKFERAYEQPDYARARAALQDIRKELEVLNESAVRSLDEGFEESLTLQRLGVFKELGISLKTTNCLESLLGQVGEWTDKVDYWRNSNQKQRWIATALLEIEPRLRRIKGYRNLPLLRTALRARKGVTDLVAA